MRHHNNIVQFPGVQNRHVLEQEKVILGVTKTIFAKMEMDNWHLMEIYDHELSVLTNYGEAIQFPPVIAGRLISVLATNIKTKSLLEELL